MSHQPGQDVCRTSLDAFAIMVSLVVTWVATLAYQPPAAYVGQPFTSHTRLIDSRPRVKGVTMHPLETLASAYNGFCQTDPYQAAVLTCGVKASLSDTISQRSEISKQTSGVSKQPYCFSRNTAFILYGALYQGATQHLIYNSVYPQIFGSGTDLSTVAAKVLCDQLIHAPLVALPVAYLVKAAIFQVPLGDAMQRYVADARRDLLWRYWAIWTPAQCLTFSVVPEHLRIPFIALVSFFWLIILSNISSRSQPSAVVAGINDDFSPAGEWGEDVTDVSVLDGSLWWGGAATTEVVGAHNAPRNAAAAVAIAEAEATCALDTGRRKRHARRPL